VQILFITSNRLGDAILSTGLLGALKDRYPEADITLVCGPLPAPLFWAVPQVRHVIELKKQPWSGHWLGLWREVAFTRWDIVVDLRQSIVSRLIMAKKRIIWKKPAGRPHKVEELGALMGFDAPAPRLWHSEQVLYFAEELIPKDESTTGLVLALAPGANSVGKTWPIERYAALAQRLTAPDGLLPNARVMLLGDERDHETVKPILESVPSDRVIDLTGAIDIAVTAACIERADFYIGNDSGLTHLAAAAGVPTLALFGPGVAWKYRPWGDHAAYISKTDDPTRDRDLCADGDDEAALALMKRITIDDAVEAATALWHKTQS
jgi:lipopolysaccharide export system permease protein